MTSMTGYAYTEITNEETNTIVEIKSVNSRFLDLSINIPPFLGRLESEIRKLCTEKMVRGKVDVFIRVQELQPKVEVTHNIEAAKSYFDALAEIALALGRTKDEVPLELVLKQDGVLVTKKDSDIDRFKDLIIPVLTETIGKFCIDREREGENLQKDMMLQVEKLEKSAQIFVDSSSKMEELFKSNVVNRFNELLGNNVDETRVLAEVAALLVKYTINEELVRFQSHILALKNEILNVPHPGKKLDFLCQELNREINTIGSKSQLKEISDEVLIAKEALENIKEQCRNVE